MAKAAEKAANLLGAFDRYDSTLLTVHMAYYHAAEVEGSQKRIETAQARAKDARADLFKLITELYADDTSDGVPEDDDVAALQTALDHVRRTGATLSPRAQMVAGELERAIEARCPRI